MEIEIPKSQENDETVCSILECENKADYGNGGPSPVYYCKYHYRGGYFGSGESYEQFQLIEEDFLEFIKFVPLNEDHLEVYSPQLRDIIIRTCIQIEVFFKEWSKEYCAKKPESDLHKRFNEKDKKGAIKGVRNWTIKDYFELTSEFKWGPKSVEVRGLSTPISPFENWSKEKDTLWWWGVYNEVKHSGHSLKKNATLKAALYSLAGLFQLHCIEQHSAKFLRKFSQVSFDESPDKTLKIEMGNYSTPIDSKRFLFKAENRSSVTYRAITSESQRNSNRLRSRI